ncbi:MAG TPA: GerMN domain-containing protein [Spirochaetota bacterium]|nr:GerMN domain-containing protein [Spirochaetota bacterium]
MFLSVLLAEKPEISMARVKKDPLKAVLPKKTSTRAKKKTSSAHYVLIIMILVAVIAVLAVNILDYNPAASHVQKELPHEDSVKSQEKPSDDKTEIADEIKDEKNDEKKENSEENLPKQVKVKSFFISVNEDSGKIKYIPFERSVPAGNDLREALTVLSKGLSRDEEKKGFLSSIPKSMKVHSAVIRGGIAYIDVSSDISHEAFGDIALSRVNQIYYTARQFPGVKGISITVNGKKVNSIGQDGRIIHWPIRNPL